MAESKITIGGSISVRMQGKQYESIEIGTTFTIETESNLTQEKLDALEEKVNTILKKQLGTRTRLAYNEYNSKLQKIKKEAGY